MPHFYWPVRVYWEDTDAGGVVFYANYLKFFERARTEWLRHLGLQQQHLRDTTQGMFVVTQSQVTYHAPARLDDRLWVSVALVRRGRASLDLLQTAWRVPADTAPMTQAVLSSSPPWTADQEAATLRVCQAHIGIAWVNSTTFKPSKIPADVFTALDFNTDVDADAASTTHATH